MASSTTTSILSLGRKSITYSAPRYTSVWPFCRPKPLTSLTVIPVMPTSCSAFFTSSNLNGLMIASTFFISSHLLSSAANVGAPIIVAEVIGPPRSRPALGAPVSNLLYRLAVKRQVETLAFDFGVDPKPDRQVDHFQDNQ